MHTAYPIKFDSERGLVLVLKIVNFIILSITHMILDIYDIEFYDFKILSCFHSQFWLRTLFSYRNSYMIQILFKFLGFEYKMLIRNTGNINEMWLWLRSWNMILRYWKSFVTIIFIYFHTVIITIESYNHDRKTIHDIQIQSILFRRVIYNKTHQNSLDDFYFVNFDQFCKKRLPVVECKERPLTTGSHFRWWSSSGGPLRGG